MMQWKRFFTYLFICVTLLSCCVVLVRDSRKVPFYSDEISWFFHIEFFEKLFLQRYISSPGWQSYESYDHPQISKYIFGAYVYAKNRNIFAVRDRLEHIWGRWNFYFRPELSDISQTEFVGYILQMREVNIVFAIITVLLLYAMSTKFIKDPCIALFVPVATAFHPLFQHTMLRATSDAAMVCFTCLAVYLMTTVWYRKNRYGPFVLGCVLGLAISSKLTGFLGIGIWGIYELSEMVFWNRSWKQNSKRMGETMIGIIAVWYISNPAVYVHPINHSFTYVTFRIRQSILLEQYFPDSALVSISSRIHATYCTLFDHICLSHGSIFPFVWLNVVLFLSGVAGVISAVRQKGHYAAMVCASMVCVILWVNTTYIPMDHDQYYLLPFICMVIMSGIGVDYIWSHRNFVCMFPIKKPRHTS